MHSFNKLWVICQHLLYRTILTCHLKKKCLNWGMVSETARTLARLIKFIHADLCNYCHDTWNIWGRREADMCIAKERIQHGKMALLTSSAVWENSPLYLSVKLHHTRNSDLNPSITGLAANINNLTVWYCNAQSAELCISCSLPVTHGW